MENTLIFYIIASTISCLSVAIITAKKPTSAYLLFAIILFLIAILYAALGTSFFIVLFLILLGGGFLILTSKIKKTSKHHTIAPKYKVSLKTLFSLTITLMVFLFLGVSLFTNKTTTFKPIPLFFTQLKTRGFDNYLLSFLLTSLLTLLALLAVSLIWKETNRLQRKKYKNDNTWFL